MEVGGERAGHELSEVERPRRDELLRLALVSPVLPRANDQAAQLLHVAQQLGAARIGDDPAQQLAEESHVAPQWRGDFLAGRFSASRGSRTQASRRARAATPR